MHKGRLFLAALAWLTLAVAAHAQNNMVVEVYCLQQADPATGFVASGDLFDSASITPNGPSDLFITQGEYANDFPLTPTESNVALGTMATGFGGTPPAAGTYDFGASPGGVPADFLIAVYDYDHPATTKVELKVTGKISGSDTVTSLSPGRSSGTLVYTINSISLGPEGGSNYTIGGSSFLTTFAGSSTPAIGLNFTLNGQALTLKIRVTQRPPVFPNTATAIEGVISSAAVPEPGTTALFVSAGLSGSLLMLRRRRRA